MSNPVRGSVFVENPGTAQESVNGQVAVPFRHIRLMGDAAPIEIAKQVNLLDQATAEATLASRSLPFSGPVSYLVGYSFTASQPTRIAHRLQTDRVRLWVGHKLAAGDLIVSSVDSTFAYVTPTATFIADVMFLVIP